MKKVRLILILNSAFIILHSFAFAQNESSPFKPSGIALDKRHRTIDSLFNLIKTDKNDTNKVNHLNNLSLKYELIGDFEKGIIYGKEALELASKLNFNEGIAHASGHIGNIYRLLGQFPRALDYALKSLKLNEELKNEKNISSSMVNIGLIYYSLSDYPKALDYYFMSLKRDQELNNKTGMARNFDNIGVIYSDQKDYPKALDYYRKALKIAEEQGNKKYMAAILYDIGIVSEKQKDFTRASEYFFKALKMEEELGNKNGEARNLGNIGQLYVSMEKFLDAFKYLYNGLALDYANGAKNALSSDYANLSNLYEKSIIPLPDSIGGKLLAMEQMRLRSLYYYKRSITIRDEIFSEENKKQLVRKEMNFEFDKKEAVSKASHDKEMAIAEAEKKKQIIVIWSVISGLLLVLVFSFFIFKRWRITQQQKNIIEKQKEKIIDSITYAQRIQESILMEEREIKNYLPDSFIFFKPKDIVSGDFYWCTKIDDKIILAAVDCTGHGVPGAFMSMIGNTLLNQIVNEKHITKPSEILQLLNLGVFEALHQEKDGSLADDGMDIALCCIDYKNNEVQFAGAQNPLYIVSANQIEVISADIHVIGGCITTSIITDPMKKEFTNHVIPIKKDMSIYLFSDGYMDQFGGSENKKFGVKRFKELLLNNQHQGMKKQKELITSTHNEWRGNSNQIDDILVMGVRI